MFGKSHEQKASEHASAAFEEARTAAKLRLADALEQAGHAGGQASHVRDTVVEKAAVAGEKWQHGVDAVAPKVHAAVDAAAPKVQAAVEAAAPKVEHARETFAEDVLPKVAETIAAVTATALAAKESAKAGAEAARENAAHRLQDYVDAAPQEWVDVIPGVEKRPKKSGKWLILLGVAAAGAVGYAIFNSRKAPEDPWSTPRYDNSGAQKTYGTGASAESKVDAVKEKAAAAGAAVAAKAGEAKEKAADKAAEVKDKLHDKAGEAGAKTEDATGKAKDAAAEAEESITEAGGDFGNATGEAADAAKDAAAEAEIKASDAWTDAQNWADDAKVGTDKVGPDTGDAKK